MGPTSAQTGLTSAARSRSWRIGTPRRLTGSRHVVGRRKNGSIPEAGKIHVFRGRGGWTIRPGEKSKERIKPCDMAEALLTVQHGLL